MTEIRATETRNVFNQLCYRVQRDDGEIFEVIRGDNQVVHSRGKYGRWNAVVMDSTLMWIEIPRFNSFIQAVRYLKAHLNELD